MEVFITDSIVSSETSAMDSCWRRLDWRTISVRFRCCQTDTATYTAINDRIITSSRLHIFCCRPPILKPLIFFIRFPFPSAISYLIFSRCSSSGSAEAGTVVWLV